MEHFNQTLAPACHGISSVYILEYSVFSKQLLMNKAKVDTYSLLLESSGTVRFSSRFMLYLSTVMCSFFGLEHWTSVFIYKSRNFFLKVTGGRGSPPEYILIALSQKATMFKNYIF
jgi:hypothetical protein